MLNEVNEYAKEKNEKDIELIYKEKNINEHAKDKILERRMKR